MYCLLKLMLYSFQAATPVANDAGGWQTHYTAEGRPYYFNPSTNVTQWDAPANIMWGFMLRLQLKTL